MSILITGMAGFIGYHLAQALASRGEELIGLDNLNDYYDVNLKYGRLEELGISKAVPDFPEGQKIPSSRYPKLSFVRMDLAQGQEIQGLFKEAQVAGRPIEQVVHLAAQAGVRYSISKPHSYSASNIQGFLNILEAVRSYPVQHLVYASSSSVYGINRVTPFSEAGRADHPASLYGASKRANELMAHSYSHLYGIPTTGLRFFTVYGPWGRPDMAPLLFTEAIVRGRPIEVFNYGNMSRDFTYIEDIVEGIIRVMGHIPLGKADWDGIQGGVSPAPAGLYNIGRGAPVRLLDFIEVLEAELGLRAEKRLLPPQLGDVPITWADCRALERDTGYAPRTDLAAGIKALVAWYRHCWRRIP
ncbi:MAG: NAD-dependent epimerase/dehydratase family protein [Spirochaetaceae bacterium]|jgi:UDP-glucuronate 4-epimerase|nr:NAD-dependent epimerase/dehydratase family protein [Spirochaetaceae bacterium]